MRHLVFVATALFPWSTDAQGRMSANLLRSLSEADRLRSVMVLVDMQVEPARFREVYPGVRVVHLDTSTAYGVDDGPRHPPAVAYVNAVSHWKSAQVFRGLVALARTTDIEYLEFPAFEGLGFCALQERRLQGFLADGLIAVRLGATHTARMQAEARPVSLADLNISDLERKTLRDCDRIVASLPGLATATKSLFGFPDEGWSSRLVDHVPALQLDFTLADAQAVQASFDQPIVFAAPLTRTERADVLVRAVAGFIRDEPRYRGDLVLAGEQTDTEYVSDLRRRAPSALMQRLRMEPALDRQPFEALVSGATVVFPSPSVSSSPAMLEASMLGARVIVNSKNPGCGPESPWVDGLNCLKFDGTIIGLVAVLKRNFAANELLQAIRLPEQRSPWIVASAPSSAWRPLDSPPKVSVVVPHYNLGAYLPETLRNLSALRYADVEVVLVDDASTDEASIRLIEDLMRRQDARLKVIRSTVNVGLAAARNLGVRHACGKYVLTLDADDLIHPDFLTVGVTALENHPESDIVVTQAGYFQDGEAVSSSVTNVEFSDYAIFCGEAVVAGLLENKFSTATALFRTAAMERFHYEESLTCYEDWSLFMRMCDAGLRFIVTTDIYFFYRRRAASMVHSPRDARKMEMEYRDMLRTSVAATLQERSRFFVIGHPSPVVVHAASDGFDTLSRKVANGGFGPRGQFDEQIAFASFKVARWLERHAPWLIRGGLRLAQCLWRNAKRKGGAP